MAWACVCGYWLLSWCGASWWAVGGVGWFGRRLERRLEGITPTSSAHPQKTPALNHKQHSHAFE